MCAYIMIFMSLNEEYGQPPKHPIDLHDLLFANLLAEFSLEMQVETLYTCSYSGSKLPTNQNKLEQTST